MEAVIAMWRHDVKAQYLPLSSKEKDYNYKFVL